MSDLTCLACLRVANKDIGVYPHSAPKMPGDYDCTMANRKIPTDQGMSALRTWIRERDETKRPTLLTAVRFTLEELAVLHPGRSVEVRVPPAGAVQIITGTTHRRGTPPAVVETTMHVWLQLATGIITWDEATGDGRVQATGERTDLTTFFPVIPGLKADRD